MCGSLLPCCTLDRVLHSWKAISYCFWELCTYSFWQSKIAESNCFLFGSRLQSSGVRTGGRARWGDPPSLFWHLRYSTKQLKGKGGEIPLPSAPPSLLSKLLMPLCRRYWLAPWTVSWHLLLSFFSSEKQFEAVFCSSVLLCDSSLMKLCLHLHCMCNSFCNIHLWCLTFKNN